MPDVQSCSRTLSTTPRQTTWNRRQCKVVCTPELNEVLTLSFRFLRFCACTYIFFFLCVYAWLHSVQFNPQLLDLQAQVVRFVLQGNFAIPICSVSISRQKKTLTVISLATHRATADGYCLFSAHRVSAIPANTV